MLICSCSFHSMLFDSQKHANKNRYLTLSGQRLLFNLIGDSGD